MLTVRPMRFTHTRSDVSRTAICLMSCSSSWVSRKSWFFSFKCFSTCALSLRMHAESSSFSCRKSGLDLLDGDGSIARRAWSEESVQYGGVRVSWTYSGNYCWKNEDGEMGHWFYMSCAYVAVSCLGLGKLLLSERSLRETSCRPNWLPELATRIGYQNWLPELATRIGYQNWLPKYTRLNYFLSLVNGSWCGHRRQRSRTREKQRHLRSVFYLIQFFP